MRWGLKFAHVLSCRRSWVPLVGADATEDTSWIEERGDIPTSQDA